jgi:murein DD-endopeptidase MepM/ murein hydrolase activator NlpD
MPTRLLHLTSPHLEGPDVEALQQALNRRLLARDLAPILVDGDYGPQTQDAYELVGWMLGLEAGTIQAGATVGAQRVIADPSTRTPEQLARARQRREERPARPLSTDPGAISEFAFQEPEGAPAADGRHFHAGKDWFAPGGSPVRAPVSGRIIETRPSLVDTGQVFGGVVKIEAPDKKVWVFRHVVPQVSVGERVHAGELVAKVTKWRSGPPHAHIEIRKTNAGGHRFENMLDPMVFFRVFVGA